MRGAGAVLLAMLPMSAGAQPSPVVYQGYVTNIDGDPVDGTTDFYLAVYDAATGGNLIDNQEALGVEVEDGSFTVELPIDTGFLRANPSLWLQIAVGTTANVLLPRQRLGSAPFALRCDDADALGGIAAGGWQRGVAACAPGNSIRAIQADGTVDCRLDAGEGGGITDLTAGDGLTGGGVGDVPLDIGILTPGLDVDVTNHIVVGFGGSGLADTAARADHVHPYLPVGGSTACPFPDKITGIDPLTGDVFCGTDTDTTYGPGPSGRITFDPTTYFFDVYPQLQLDSITVPATDRGYSFDGTRSGVVTIAATDFQPSSSGYGYYFADGNSSRGTLTTGPASTHVYAPLHLPRGAYITEVRVTYEIPWEPQAEVTCWLDATDVWTGTLSQPGGPTPDCFTCPRSAWSVWPGVFVDDLFTSYTAHCFLHTEFGSDEIGLFAYQVFYDYTDLQGPLP